MVPRTERDKLIEDHTAFVERVVMKTVRMLALPSKYIDDYISAGYLGLVEAAERYDQSKGASFKSYAYLRIRGAIIDHIRNHSEIKGRAYRRARAVSAMEYAEIKCTQRIGQSLAPQHKLGEIIQLAGLSAMSFRLSSWQAAEVFEEMECPDRNPEEILLFEHDTAALRECIAQLPDRERFIIEEYYYNGKSFSDLLRMKPDLSKSWLSRLHTKALTKLTAMMEERFREAA